MKRCSTCKASKPLGGFSSNRSLEDGLQSACKSCNKAWYDGHRDQMRTAARAYLMANRDRINADRRASRAEHPERFAASAKAHRDANLDRYRSYKLKANYGITSDEYELILRGQGNGCAACGRNASEFLRRMAVDHNHETGEVRGILCMDCNVALGLVGDDVDRLRALQDYLLRGVNLVGAAV